jgi:hypothetical protein
MDMDYLVNHKRDRELEAEPAVADIDGYPVHGFLGTVHKTRHPIMSKMPHFFSPGAKPLQQIHPFFTLIQPGSKFGDIDRLLKECVS